MIITVTMMVLLAMLAIGLLGLSSIAVRSASRGNSMQLARSNARLAMALAIGDLQKKLGPDQRISAPASIVSENAPSGVTGAWEAWTRDELGSGYDTKDNKFVGWLSSDTLTGQDSASGRLPYVGADEAGSALLLGDNSLGDRQTLKSDDQRIAARKMPIDIGTSYGNFAWMTFDESIKSRIDLHPDLSRGGQLADIIRAGGPGHDRPSVLAKLDGVKPDAAMVAKMASFSSSVLATEAPDLPAYRPDLSIWSMSLMTDPVEGGLKKDLSTHYTKGLSSEEGKEPLYASSGLTTGPSDPPHSLLAGYHDLYKLIGQSANRVDPGPGGISAKLPRSYRPSRYNARTRTDVPNRLPHTEPILVPSIVRVDVIFSIVTRDVHGGRAGGLRSRGYPYMLHMMYLPVVTLHNPYNVPLVFQGMKLTFKDLPIGFKFIIDGQPMTTEMIPLNNLYVYYENSNNSKEFGITLKENSRSSQPLRLEPGQTKIFGTPRVPPTWTWSQESPGAGADGVHLFDWRSDKTSEFDLAPTLITQSTTTACGFDVDWLAPRPLKTPAAQAKTGEGIIPLKGTENIGVQFGPIAQPSNTFSISTELTSSGRGMDSGVININYGDVDRLTEIVEEGTSVRFPDARSFPATFPQRGVDGTIRVRDIYEPNNRQVKDYVFAKPFALFSLSARTTRESFVPSRPFADSSPVVNLADIDLTENKETPGDQPFELVMMPIRNNTAVIEELRATQEGYFFGGHGSLNGSPRATFYEVPQVPMQSLAQFRHANLASSGYHPFTTYTVGESRAHPMLPGESVEAESVTGDKLLDHTWLSNSALWDSYFLSTMADYNSEAFGSSGDAVDKVRSDFFEGEKSLINPRMTPLVLPERAAEASTAISADDGWLAAARYLGLKGGFNVNSTSIDAWKSALSALRESELDTEEGETSTNYMSAFPRVRRPSETAIDGQPILTRQLRWQGFRQLSDPEIENLAKLIVDQIRERGPFLSLSEFVNRRLGDSADERSQSGALQSAITKSGINDIMIPDGLEIDAGNIGNHAYQNPEAAFGSNTAGAPGSLSQGDLLSVIGGHLTVRGDTFVIRSYGEATDKSGNVLARAWCEGVVQRRPEFVDPTDEPETPGADLEDINKRFGRKFELISFRWLAPEEI